MNDKLNDRLQRMYEHFDKDHDRLREELMASLPEQVPQQKTVGRTTQGRQLMGSKKMKRRIIVTSAIAACLILVLLGFWPGSNGNGRVYAMSDVPELLRNAKIIHAVGWTYIPPIAPPGQERTKAPLEMWIDTPNGKQRNTSSSYATGPDGTTVFQQEYVSDGEFTMQVNHATKTVEFKKFNAFHRRLTSHRTFDTMLKQYFGDPEKLAGFANTGSETIDNKVFDIWEGVVSMEPSGVMNLKIQCWLAPDSGEIGRCRYWMQAQNVSPDWLLALELKIERDVQVPSGIFETTPPEGYTLKNTKETAPVMELTGAGAGGVGIGNLSMTYSIAFMLTDGSILLAWNSIDKNEDTQADLYKNLVFGGPLPKLPMEIYKLTPKVKDSEATLIGYHLTHTQKNGVFYEWSIYVPKGKLPLRETMAGYRAMYRLNPADRHVAGTANLSVSMEIPINSATDFDDLVLGAMAELSDDGEVQENITYESVMALSAKLREEFAGKNKH